MDAEQRPTCLKVIKFSFGAESENRPGPVAHRRDITGCVDSERSMSSFLSCPRLFGTGTADEECDPCADQVPYIPAALVLRQGEEGICCRAFPSLLASDWTYDDP